LPNFIIIFRHFAEIDNEAPVPEKVRRSGNREAATEEWVMQRVRLAAIDKDTALVLCCRCGRNGGRWDRIADSPYCPHCLEGLALGEAEPLILKTVKNRCAVCDQAGTVNFLTFPLQALEALELDLCPEHLRGLVGRHLGPFAYHQLRRQLDALAINVNNIFLLHDAFYDHYGRALHPLSDLGLAG
jgi:hypothetical protein